MAKVKVEKVIKKHFGLGGLLCVLLSLVIGIGIGFSVYYFISDRRPVECDMIGEDVIVLNIGDIYEDQGIECSDKKATILKQSNVDTSKAGYYTVTYTVFNDSILNVHSYQFVFTRVVRVVGE